MSRTYDNGNPFLRNIPMVAIVRATTARNGERLTTPDTECRRIFFRVGNNRVKPQPSGYKEIMHSGTSQDALLGFNKLLEFNPTEINADLNQTT